MRLTHPLVRELAWCCFAADQIEPALLASYGVHPFNPLANRRRRRWLADLDRRPQALEAHIAALASQRLGQRFEAFWHFFLGEDPRYRLRATNLAVRDAGHTVGEFDVIVTDRDTGVTWHLELAAKFYLGVYGEGDGRTAWAQWWGPSRRDRLDIKLGHLLRHQLQLAGQPAAAQLLAERAITVDRRAAVVRGRMFYPEGRTRRAPLGLRANAPTGAWLTLQRLRADTALQRARFTPLSHDRWLQPPQPAGATLSHAEFTDRVAAQLTRSPSPCMAVARSDTAGPARWRYLFITPAGWAAGAVPARHGTALSVTK